MVSQTRDQPGVGPLVRGTLGKLSVASSHRPMPYGTETDWLRNLQAAGHGVIELDHHSYSVDTPEVVPADEVMQLLSPMVARIVRLYETEKALRLHVAVPAKRLSA